jgi:double-strand break repair protein MRE11
MKHLMDIKDVDEDDITNEMEEYRTKLEGMFASGQVKKTVSVAQ